MAGANLIRKKPIDVERLWKQIKHQESRGQQFDKYGRPLISSAGAVGIAQVMPAVGEAIAKQNGIPWDQKRFYNDAAYNERLGKIFFQHLVKKYDGDIPKILAGYNRGETLLDKGVAKHGNQWQSHLPAETKDYIHRILGAYGSQSQAQYAGIAAPQEVAKAPPPPVFDTTTQTTTKPDLSFVTKTPVSRLQDSYPETQDEPTPTPQSDITAPDPIQEARAGQPAPPPQSVDLSFATAMGPSSPGVTDPLAVPGIDDYPTPYYDSQGALQSGVRPNEGTTQKIFNKFIENVEEGSLSNAANMGLRWLVDKQNEQMGISKLSPEEANRMYPGLPEPFSEPVDPVVAKMISDSVKRRKANAMWNERGESLGFAGELAAGIPAFVGDPINLAITLATGMGLGAAGAKGLSAVLAENAITGIAAEQLRRVNRAQEQDPVAVSESVANIALDTVGGTAFHYGIKFLGGGLKGAAEKIRVVDQDTVRRNIVNRIKGAETGQVPKAADIAMDQAKREAGFTAPGVPQEHIHNPNIELSKTRFFVPFADDGRPIAVGDSLDITTAVDNPNSARNMGKSVREIRVPEEAKFAKMSDPLDAPQIAQVISELKSQGVEIKVSLPENPTLGDLLRRIKTAETNGLSPSGTMEKVNAAFQTAGFTGYRDTLAFDGNEVSHRLHVFDPESMPYGPLRSTDQTKVYKPTEGELRRREAEQELPENSVDYDPLEPKAKTATKLSEPDVSGISEQSRLEGERARKTVEVASEQEPALKQGLAQIDEQFKLESSAEKIVTQMTDMLSAGYTIQDSKLQLQKELALKGEPATPEMIESLGDALNELRSKSVDSRDFRNKAQAYLEGEVVGWATLKKIERQMFLAKFAESTRLLKQDIKGRSTFDKLYSLVVGGEVKLGEATNLATGPMADGFSTIYRKRLRNAWGPEGSRVIESGVIDREIVQELSNIEAGGTSPVSGNSMAFKLAKDFHAVSESLFATKAGYSPFLKKIEQHLFRQTHARDKVSEAGFEKWFEFVYPRFGESSFPELSLEKRVEQFKRIYDEIANGTHGASYFDSSAGEGNIAYRIARKRTLIPRDWQAFYEYNVAFGKGNMALTMTDTIQAAARDIAVMSKFTSTPKKFITSLIEHSRKSDPDFEKDYKANKSKLEAAFAAATFAYEAPALNLAAKGLVGSQKIINAAVNGAAYLRSFQDFAPIVSTTTDQYGGNWLSNFGESFLKYWNYFLKGRETSADIAESLGVFVDSGLKQHIVEMGGDATSGSLGKLTELHSWLSLMQKDKAVKSAMIAEVASNRLARLAKTPWKDLKGYEQAGLLRYGINERVHSILKEGIVKIDGRDFLTPEGMLSALERSVQAQATLLGVNPKDIVVLEKSPSVKDKKSSKYESSDPLSNPYADVKSDIFQPRPESGVRIGEISKAYSPDSASQVSARIFQEFNSKGYKPEEAHIPATLMSTFFDVVGKASGKDPLTLFDQYGFSVQRIDPRRMNSLGFLAPSYEGGKGNVLMGTMKGVVYDKTVIHEMSHFFLEVLRDAKLIEGLSGDFKEGMDTLFKWLGTNKTGNVNVAAHERFANSFEVFLRTNKAPTTALEKVFSWVRDWYRRALFMAKSGMSRMAFSLSNPERAPIEVENFYRKLMGGEGATEHLGDLTSLMEMLPQEQIATAYKPTMDFTPVPSQATDLVLKIASILNEHADIGTTSASQRDRVFMYGGSDVNSLHGMLMRSFWAFKSSATSQFNSMRRSFYSNPDKPQGDWMKLAHFGLTSAGLWAIQDQVHDLITGKTPKPMNTPEYAARALVGSGAMGYFGDTLVRSVMTGHDVRSTTLGIMQSAVPTLGTFASGAATMGETVEALLFDPSKRVPTNDIARNLIQNTPFQSLFYGKAAMNFYLLNGIREFAKPGSLMREEMRTLDRGQQYNFFRPTESNLWLQ